MIAPPVSLLRVRSGDIIHTLTLCEPSRKRNHLSECTLPSYPSIKQQSFSFLSPISHPLASLMVFPRTHDFYTSIFMGSLELTFSQNRLYNAVYIAQIGETQQKIQTQSFVMDKSTKFMVKNAPKFTQAYTHTKRRWIQQSLFCVRINSLLHLSWNVANWKVARACPANSDFSSPTAAALLSSAGCLSHNDDLHLTPVPLWTPPVQMETESLVSCMLQ